MEEVYDKLYVGSDEDYERLQGREGWSFLRCCKYGPDGHQQILGYHTRQAPDDGETRYVAKSNSKHLTALNMLDLDDPNFVPADMVQSGLTFISNELAKGRKVLVACNKGRSRGPSVALMWLRSVGDMPHAFLHSERKFHVIYPPYDPKQGINQFTRMHWPNLGETGKV